LGEIFFVRFVHEAQN